jgi:hypothetical protein
VPAGPTLSSFFITLPEPPPSAVAGPPRPPESSGYLSGVMTGSWRDWGDWLYYDETQNGGNAVIRGTVVSEGSGNPAAPIGLEIKVTCLNNPSAGSTTTSISTSSGGFNLAPPYCWNYYGGGANRGLVITAVNDGIWGVTWYNWNESIIVWAPQVVNIDVPTNFISTYLPSIIDYGDTNSTNGLADYSNIGHTESSTYTQTEMDCSTWFGVFGGCHGRAVSFSAGTTDDSQIGNLFVSQQYHTTGLAVVDGLNYSVLATNVTYFGPYDPPQDPALQPILDLLTPTTYVANGGHLLAGCGAAGYGIPITHRSPVSGGVKTESSVSTGGVRVLRISIGFGFEGGASLGIGIGIVDMTWSQIATTTHSYSLNWTAQVPTGGSQTCYVAYGMGGSQSANTADRIGVWAHPTSVGSNPCPIPTTDAA